MFTRSYPILSRFVIWVFLPLALMLISGYLFILQSLPKQQGVISVEGLQAPVAITRDEHGVPRINASTDEDAFFALGYVHAQDRMWQMSFSVRLGQGRLSEIIGLDALNADKLMRTFGLYRAAENALESLDEPARKSLSAYANGVNAWIDEQHTLPIEFYVLGVEPEHWKPADSLLLIKLMSLTLGQNYQRELSLDLLIKELGIDKADEFMPNINSNDTDEALIANTHDLIDASLITDMLAQGEQLSTHLRFSEEGIGSNAWAVSGKFTNSGLPYLAGDPHLGVEMPSVWYLAEIQGDRLHVTGATYPGVPIVLMGHNDSIAWSTTNMYADTQDLYLERINPLNENQYELDGKWLDMDIRDEVIHVKPNFPAFLTDPITPVSWQVRSTRNGPLISDVNTQASTPVALRWTALDKQDKTFQSFLEVNYANNWNSFKAALSDYSAPAINFVYADVHGDIGLFGAGKVPIRGDSDGRLPTPGWHSRYDWRGYIPFTELPQQLNPKEGYIVNANSKNHSDDYPYLVANHWGLSYRGDRIHEILNDQIESGKKLDGQLFSRMQGDVKSLQFKEVQPFLQQLTGQTPEQKEVIERLSQWDGVMSEDSEEAAVYQVWLKHFNMLLVGDDLRGSLLHERRSNELQHYVGSAVQYSLIGKVLNKDKQLRSDWCDRIGTTERESCEEIALLAIDETNEELSRFVTAGKRWKDIHEINYGHSIFSNVRILDFVFNRKTGWGGDRTTLNAGTWNYSQQEKYRTLISAAYRQVIDLGNLKNSGFINSTGQSGNVFSPHYDDNIQPFKDQKLLPMHFDAELNSSEAPTLHLKPIQ
ncbi:hypothetical protein BB427_16155 [Pseudoalteromonas sp. BMB]|uniref:penicillin acylase family protein n=1 Tax=Pseudoalteromonas sp. BMB TaxID=1874619 RepID=UPI00083E05D9|nr:penicillin acylase family protein [Pseudoalteromonas sp. BMB]ODB36262.1 hypothetical protein BB427_16155 [Pseudoalteromonas sp. BMB]